MPVDKFGRMSDNKTKDTGVSLTYINNNYVRSDGSNPVTGSIDMKGNTLYNVADPVNPQDVVTKVYVDNTKGSGVIGGKTGDSVSIKENLDFLGKQKIKNLPDPVNDHDAVTKEYVDTTTVPFLKLDQTKYNTKGDIDMGDQFTVLNVKTPINDNHIVDKKYVDEMDNLKSAFSLKSGGYEAKGAIFMKKHKLGGLQEPTQDGEATTKKYVDDLVTNHFVDENDNITFGRDVDMEGNKIFSLPEPDQDSNPATKKYVDDLQNQYIDRRGNINFGRNINLDNKRIFALKDPKKDYEATNKKYVDDTINKRIQEEKDNFLPQDPATKEYVDEAIKQVAGGDILVSKEGVFIKANGHYRATAPLDIDNHKMENLPDPVDEKDAVNKKYIDGIIENLTLKQGLIRENGGFNLVDSYINMNFNNIRNVGYPKHNEDAVPRSFVDDMVKTVEEKIQKIKEKSEERPFLKENGNYQASTSINMNFNRLLNLQKPTELYDAATKDYVDYVEKEIKEKLKKRKQLITVNARYCGPLEEGDYPFKFGGNTYEACENIMGSKEQIKSIISGFVMPHPGYIKKIIGEGLAFIEPNEVVNEVINLLNPNEINELKKHFGKEDFKNDLLEKIKTDIVFKERLENSEIPQYTGKTFFEIVKIEKNFTGEKNKFLIWKYTPDTLVNSRFISNFEWLEVNISNYSLSRDIKRIRVIMKIINKGEVDERFTIKKGKFKEGDVLNIRISDFKKNLFTEDNILDNVLKTTVIFLLGILNFNFTFLIELDPLDD